MKILTLNRIILFFLFLIILTIKSCISDENNEEHNVINKDIQSSLLPDNDQVTINTLEEYIMIDFNEKNKNNYIASFVVLPNNIIKIEFSKFYFNDNIKQEISNNYIIENTKKYSYELSFNKEDINLSIKDFYTNIDYNTMVSYKDYKNNQSQLSFIDLTKKEFCSKNNSFIISINSESKQIQLNLENKKFNNLSCGKINLISLLNTYTFNDNREFELLEQSDLLINIEKNIKKSLEKYNFIDFYKDNDYYYFYLNQDKNNIKSIKAKINNRKLMLQVSKFNHTNVIPISVIKINKREMLNNPAFIIEEENYSDSEYYTEINSINIFNNSELSFYKQNFSLLKNLDCQEYSYSSMFQNIEYNKSTIYLNKNIYDKSYKCTIKPVITHIENNDTIKLSNGNIYYGVFLKENFNIEYEDNQFNISAKNEYDIYDYTIENNQLFVYVDKKDNQSIIVNEKIDKIELPYFSNINFINVENNNFINEKIKKLLSSYRSINEELNINIFKFNMNNDVDYYLLRSNSIQLDKNLNKCKFDYKIDKISSHKYDFNLIDQFQENCTKYGISGIIVKKIGYNTEVNFKEKRSDFLLNHLKDRHDLFYKNIHNNIKSDKFEIASSLLLLNNNKLFYSINLKYLNNDFDTDLNYFIKNNEIYLKIDENNQIKSRENDHILIPIDKENKKINIIYKDLDGKEEKFTIIQ